MELETAGSDHQQQRPAHAGAHAALEDGVCVKGWLLVAFSFVGKLHAQQGMQLALLQHHAGARCCIRGPRIASGMLVFSAVRAVGIS